MKKSSFRKCTIFMFLIVFMFSVFTVSTASAASDCKISLSKISECKNGYIGEITIKNAGNKELDQWKLEFDWEKEISDVLNATLVSRQNNHYIITFNKSNSTIPAGKSLKIKIKGKKAIGSSRPANYKLTDIYDELALKDKEWQDFTARKEAEAMQKSFIDYASYYGYRFESSTPFTTGYSIIEKDPFKNNFNGKYNTVYFKTQDGLTLKGAFFPVKKAKGTIIYLHGRTGYAAGSMDSIEYLIKAGYQVFAYNARVWNYYKTPEQYVGDVRKDIDDVGSAIEYLKTRHDVDKKKIGIYGASYGASKAITSAARYKDIKVLLSEAGMAYICDLYGMPKDDVWLSFMKIYMNIPQDMDLTKDQYNAVDYSSAIKDVHVPVLILHGMKDSVIPLSSANLLMENANGPKEIYLMPESDHCNWFQTVDKAEYEKTVLNFLDKYLAR